MHKYESVKEWPKPNDIIQFMRNDHGVEISYSLAWEAREFEVNVVRGIPKKGYEKILKYLHMMREANPGSHTFYETDSNGRFRFLSSHMVSLFAVFMLQFGKLSLWMRLF